MPFHVHEVGAASRTTVDPLTGHRQPPCRFAVSPLWELREAVRALEAPGCGEEWQLPWLRRIRTAASGLDLRPLWPLLRERATTPEFLCPPPSRAATAIEDELARVRAADPARAATELTRSAAGTGARGRAPAADPARAVRELADLLELAWRALLAPHWPWLRGLLEADAAFHARRLADEGPSALFRELHPRLGWEEGALTVRTGSELARLPADSGLVLLPSVFVRADVVAGAGPGWRRTVAYPARGTAGLWAELKTPAVLVERRIPLGLP
ncbi:DUF5937 family protein, partial [Streptomyces pathocidini]|uniref:DUF5937 family protein n=1 Tax=Streptomyces pathocidini TaxID=1650571 RepID=UPI0033F677B0